MQSPEYVILPSPVKIGDRERVESYAKTLTNGQEQLLVARDCSLFITDGKGGYLEFKTLNSGMTREEIEHAIEEIQSEYTEGFNSLSEDYTKHKEDNDKLFKELNLKFEKYVTTEELDKIKELATHSNRETLDKFSEDDEGNPLYNNKKIVADFDTSEIDKKIADIKLRTHIGKELDNLYLTLPEVQTTNLVTNGIINFSNKISGNMEITGNKILCKAYRKYHLLAGICTSSTGYCRFGVYNENTQSFTGRYANAISIDYNGIAGNQVLNDYLEFNEDTYITIRIVLISNTTKIDNLQSNLYIQEINRQVILDPAEDAKNLEFIYDKYDAVEQKYSIKTSSKLNIINKDGEKVESIKLLKGIKYEIEWNINSVGLEANLYYSTNILLINNDTNETISFMKNNYYYGAEQGYDITGKNNNKFVIIPENDINVSLMIKPSGNINVYNGYLIIKEISHPYYFNYYKDSLSSKVLFEGEANAVGEYQLLDDVSNYEWLEFSIRRHTQKDCMHINKINVSDIIDKMDSITNQDFNITNLVSTNITNNCITLNFPNENTFKITTISNSIEIYKIVGYGFNYDNPYKDLISSGDNTLELSEEEYNDMITDIKGGDV